MQANRILSLFALSSLVALTGCSEKTPVEETTEVATSEAVASTETVTAESTAITEPVAEVEVVEVVDENPPKFTQITDYIAVELNKNWNWSNLSGLPGVESWLNETPVQDRYSPEGFNYYMNGSLKNYGGIFVQGTETEPNAITFGSDEGKVNADYELDDFFRISELTRVTSDCDVNDEDSFLRQFYKWEQEGQEPLYIYVIRDSSAAVLSTDYGIAKNLNDFYKPEYVNPLAYLRSRNNEIDNTVCSFDV